MARRIFRYLFFGIAWGCICFVFTGVAGVLVSGEAFLEPVTHDFVAQAMGGVVVGICCASTAIVYTFDRLPSWLKIGIHFAVGLTGYFLVAFRLKWIPTEGTGYIAASILLAIAIFIVIWLGFYLAARREAAKVNARLQELGREEDPKEE